MPLPQRFLFRNKEVNHFLLYSNSKRTGWRTHQSAVNTNQSLACLEHFYLTSAVRMYTLMIEELATYKQIYALKQLRHARMINHADIKQSVIRNGIGCLSITSSIAHAHCHDATVKVVVVDLDMHAVFKSLEYHKYE